MTSSDPIIFLSSGEPAGIGPDVCAMVTTEDLPARVLVLGDAELLTQRAAALGLRVTVRKAADPGDVEQHVVGVMSVLDIPAPAAVRPGHPDSANAPYVLELLRRGAQLCANASNAALVTAPVQKSTINAAGAPFTGHTEFLAEVTGAQLPVMMLAAGDLRVALATTHLPLAEVAGKLSRGRLECVVRVLDTELRERFGLETPRIAVLGLNPHAGEQGVLGCEEREIIEPVIRSLTDHGLRLHGPVPADTAFTPAALERCDAVLAMYHDQGLPAIKALAFGKVVNITLGLPIIRTSVDHGTALALAGEGRANPGSLREAIRVACSLARAQTG